MKQKTINSEIALSGAGLHTGNQAHMTLKPAEEHAGLYFVRMDLPGQPVIKVEPDNVLLESKVPRCTSLGRENAVVHTVEHLMSVLNGLGISNLRIEIDSNEVPGLDGSGAEFLKAIRKVGIKEQAALQEVFTLREPISVERNGSSIWMMPADDFRVSYTLNYDHPYLKSQYFSTVVNADTYTTDIAPSRTFCLESEAKELKLHGLGKGANYQNTLVVGETGVIENKERFTDEFARHKVLDFIGDLYLLGMPVKGHAFAIKSGHTLNLTLLKKIWEQKQRCDQNGAIGQFDIDGKEVIEIDGIMKILPHRYPFLFVDRVVQIEKGKRAVGIKNVTINDNFFQGHFPTRPVMPGVLMIEAMAQTAGVVVLTNEQHRGKVAFFMAVDKVKFRKVVSPGDVLAMHVEVVKDKSRTAVIHAEAKVGEETVCEADMVFSFTDASYLD